MIDYNMSLTLLTYESLTTALNSVLNTGATPNICLFVDVEGNVPYKDADGNIYDPASVSSVNYTQPHNNEDGTAVVNGFITINFTNGHSVVLTDTVDVTYFSIEAVPFKPRRF
jgi:hypothetical protein